MMGIDRYSKWGEGLSLSTSSAGVPSILSSLLRVHRAASRVTLVAGSRVGRVWFQPQDNQTVKCRTLVNNLRLSACV